MQLNLTLDEMILRYSENPFVDEKTYNNAIDIDRTGRQRMLSKLLLIASNLFERFPETNLSFYKRRYEFS